jgi:hypothetical protein
MTKHLFALMSVVLLVSALSISCEDTENPCEDCGGFPPPPVVKDLTHREDVLTNVELAYNKRRIDWYQGVLDQNFTFFLSTGDVNNGLPVSWNRPDEIDVNTKLLDPNYPDLPCQSVFMDIRVEDGLSWIEFTPESAPTETWYQATLYYDFKFEISPNRYIPLTGAKAVFTVRDAGKFGKYDHHWQLVEMRDLGSDATVSTPATVAATEPSTWGQVKALYR